MFTRTRSFKIVMLIFLGLQVSACATNVKAWEKGDLAKEIMAIEPDALQRAIREQTVTSKEAASGGYSVVGGGCGCN